jgi:hypothetical protein
MKEIEKFISPLIESQFPAFYREEGPLFITFVKAYYEWLEANNNALYHARRLAEYADIDSTVDSFIVYFKEKYLKNIQFTTESNKQLFIKHALEFYRAKGSQRSVDLFFRLVYGIPAEVYTPSNDVFRLSDATYAVPQYLEITKTPKNIEFVGKQITGTNSRATAFVERLIRKKINKQTIDVFMISNLKKDFQIHEALIIDSNIDNSPRVIGSLSRFEVVAGGTQFKTGDIVEIDSTISGAQAKGRVVETEDITGLVDFALIDGGWGYSTTANVIISDRVLLLSNVNVTNTQLKKEFLQFETLTQPLSNIVFDTLANGIFVVGDTIQRYYANGTLSANARVLSITQNTVAGTGEMFVSILSGNTGAGNNTIYKTGNNVTATVNVVYDKTVTSNVMAISDSITLYCANVSGTFAIGDTVNQTNSTAQLANGVVTSVSGTSANLVVNITRSRGAFKQTERLYNITTNSSADITLISTHIGVVDITNAFVDLEGNYVTGSNSQTNAVVITIGEGSLAGFSVSNISYEETVAINDDLIRSKNFGNVFFTSIRVDGSNSNVSANGYGFKKFPYGNLNSILIDCLTIENKTIGTITNITNINPGTNYNIDPLVTIIEPAVVAQNANDYFFIVANVQSNFTTGEIVTQTQTIVNVNTLAVSNVTTGNIEYLSVTGVNGVFTLGEVIYQSNGIANVGYGTLQTAIISGNTGTLIINPTSNGFNNTYSVVGATSSANANVNQISYKFFQIGEPVYQSNGTGNVATGTIYSSNINSTTRAGTILVYNVSNNFTVSNSTSLQIQGISFNANAYINTVNVSNASVVTKGLIKSIPDSSSLYVKRLSLANFFSLSGNTQVKGVSSGATATLIGLDYTDTIAGLNAVVSANVVTGNGYVTSLELVDSGFGYTNGEVLNFYSADKSRAGTTKLILEKQGKGEGYFQNQKGFLSENSHLFDGAFYQEYSYQIISRLPFDTYADIFKKVLHTAGTGVYGKVELTDTANSFITAPNTSLMLFGNFINVSNTETIETGLFVYQSNGVANIASGYINDTPSAVIIVANASVGFVVGTAVKQPNSITNTCSGLLDYKVSNATHTTLYIANTKGVFANSLAIEGIANSTGPVYETHPSSNIISAINTLEISNTTGSFSANSISTITVLFANSAVAATADLTSIKIVTM